MSHLLLESGGALLQESGGFILLEPDTTTVAPPAATHGGSHEPSPATRAYWESEGERLRVLVDDEEVLMLL